MKDRIELVADLLMGAAHADSQMHGREGDAVRKMLGEVLENPDLPAELDQRLRDFKVENFNLQETAAAFKDDADERKRKLLELVVAVHEADDELDLDEDAYLRSLAEALGMPEEAYQDLALEVEIEELRADLEEVRQGD